MTHARNTVGLKPPWKPGQTGNPNGRPKKVQQIIDRAQEHAEAALDALIELVNSEDERVKLQAATALLDRGLGKPKQTVEDVTSKTEVSDYTVDELRALAGMGSKRATTSEDGEGKPDCLQ